MTDHAPVLTAIRDLLTTLRPGTPVVSQWVAPARPVEHRTVVAVNHGDPSILLSNPDGGQPLEMALPGCEDDKPERWRVTGSESGTTVEYLDWTGQVIGRYTFGVAVDEAAAA